MVAAVWLDPKNARALRRAGVRDSKAFGQGESARRKRAQLAELVERRAECVAWESVSAQEVDRWVSEGQLNALERELALHLFSKGPAAARVIADGQLFAPLCAQIPGLRALARADARFTAVSAASIVAKHHRDRLFLAAAAAHGDLAPMCLRGMGYANANTHVFLDAYVQRHGRLPPETRLSWRWPVLDEVLAKRQLTLF